MACEQFKPEFVELESTGDYAVYCNGLFLTSLETEQEAAQLTSNIKDLLEAYRIYLTS